MKNSFKTKSISLLVPIVVFGGSYGSGNNVIWSSFWSVLVSVLFYALWSLADIINDYEKWKESVDKGLKKLDGLSEDFNTFKNEQSIVNARISERTKFGVDNQTIQTGPSKKLQPQTDIEIDS